METFLDQYPTVSRDQAVAFLGASRDLLLTLERKLKSRRGLAVRGHKRVRGRRQALPDRSRGLAFPTTTRDLARSQELLDVDFEMHPPTFEDIVAARKFNSPYLPKTPLSVSQRSQKISTAIIRKTREPSASRRIQSPRRREPRRLSRRDEVTLVTASTGNHGQSIGYAGSFTKRVIIYAPQRT